MQTASPPSSNARATTDPCGPAELGVLPMRTAEQLVLVVLGEADLHTAGQLRRRLLTALAGAPPAVVIELGALEFCDLNGLDALHDAAQIAHHSGIAVTFRGMSPLLALMHRTWPPAGPARLSA